MISRKSKPARRVKFATFRVVDNEVFVFDGNFRIHSTVDDFVGTLGDVSVYYSHDLSLSIHRIMATACRIGAVVRSSFSTGNPVTVTIASRSREWRFVDARHLLRAQLDEIFEWGDILRSWEDPADSVMGLYEALRITEAELNEFGCPIGATIAGVAMDLFRRVYCADRIFVDHQMNKRFRGALYGGRSEVFEHLVGSDPSPSNSQVFGYIYDAHSCYGAGMLGQLPGRPSKLNGCNKRLGTLSITKATVNVPECYLPPLPYRERIEDGESRTFYPYGSWTAWFTSEDLRTLQISGGNIERIHESYHFDPWDDPSRFADDMYSKRFSGGKLREKLVKWIIQSFSGKLGQRPGSQRLLINPRELPELDHNCRMIFPGAYIITDERPSLTTWVPASAFITSRGRTALLMSAFKIITEGHRLFCCDTDSWHTSGMLPESEAMGGWEMQAAIAWAHYAAPKLYAVITDVGEEIVAARGLPDMSVREYLLLMRGDEMRVDSLTTLKESVLGYHTADPIPTVRRHRVKRICQICYSFVIKDSCEAHPGEPVEFSSVRPKRFSVGNLTYPWCVTDLELGVKITNTAKHMRGIA